MQVTGMSSMNGKVLNSSDHKNKQTNKNSGAKT